MSKLRLFFLIILIPLMFFQCDDDHPVPEIYVYKVLELNNPLYIDLNAPGNSIYIPNEGNKGIIVTRMDYDRFDVFDATCTHDPQDPEAYIKIDGVFGICTVCGSTFSLFDYGGVFEGPATIPLKMYAAEYNPNLNSLIIHN